MKTLLITLSAVFLTHICHANEEATNMAKSHLSNFLKGEYKKLSDSYSEKIQLMPGHEFLKKEYQLSKSGDRSKAIEVTSSKLITVMEKVSKGQPSRPIERIENMLKTLHYKALKTTQGDFATAPSDRVGTPDGKLHFSIKKDDVLLKVSPPKGDFLLLQMRKIDGKWKVISEYLD